MSENSNRPFMEMSSIFCKILKTCHFPIGILGQLWYLIVSIPDPCTPTYFASYPYDFLYTARLTEIVFLTLLPSGCEGAICFSLAVLAAVWLLCSVALPRGAVGWYVVCDCSIICSYMYSLTF